MAFSSLMISTAEAPSVICDELPAVTLPSGLKAGLSLASVSAVVPGRMPFVGLHEVVDLDDLAGLLVEPLLDHRDDLVVEATLVVACSGELLAAGAEGVEVFAREAPLVGDELGRDALRHEAAHVGVAHADRRAEREAERAVAHRGAHRDEAHDLDAGGDDDVVRAGDDALRGEVGRLLRRAALAIDGGGRDRLGEAGAEHGVAPDVDGLGADLHDAAHDHVVDQGGVEVVALDQRLERLGGQVGRVPARQLPVALAARRCGRRRR